MSRFDGIRRGLEDDGWPTPEVGNWVLKKYEAHARYAHMFATGMKNLWPQRCYLGLCTGSGRVRLRSTGEIVESSAMSVLRLPDPFTKYIFCDRDEEALEALRHRVSRLHWDPDIAWVRGDVNDRVPEILDQMPHFDSQRRLLSLCFLDPFATNIRFDTIRALSDPYLMDFLVVLPLGVDARRNLRLYLRPDQSRIDAFLGDAGWREKLEEARGKGENLIHFLGRRFAEQMGELGYQETAPRDMLPVRSSRRDLLLYVIGLFTKSERGKDFWKKTLAGLDEQLALELPP